MAKNNKYHMIFFILFLDLCLIYGESSAVGENETTTKSQQMVNVGVILDLDTPVGKMAHRCISMAITDFYARNANYRTKLNLTVKDSRNDVVSAASAALELLNNEEVQAIIGPQTSNQAKFVISLGEKAQIPIISFSATSPSLSLNRFFIRTALVDSYQVKAITSIVQRYGWREVVLIYEDTEYGNGLISYIVDAFQQIDTRVPYRSVISPSSSRLNILRKLNKLMAMQTRVFLVHMTASLGSKLFVLAKDAGMMSEGYAWIITDGLSSMLHPEVGQVIDSMEGVVGITPYVPMSTGLKDFEMRWKRKLHTIGTTKQTHTKMSVFGLWAYDTIWALAKAVELVEWQTNYSSALKKNNKGKSTGGILGQIDVSKSGPRLLKTLLSTRFEGLSGEFRLSDQQFQPAAFKIFNVISKREIVIGYWTPNKETFDDLLQSGLLTKNSSTSTSMVDHREFIIKPPIWPGNTSSPPKGWAIPITGKKLRIGVPVTSDSFNEFMKIEWYPDTNESKSLSGFSYDVFLAALERMPFALPHKFIPFTNGSSREPAGTYDDLLYQIKLNKFDAVVADTSIIANRTSYVDFTLPYSESGVRMVVKVKDDKRKNMWIFLKPLTWDLWLTTGGAFIFTAVVVWFLEHNQNTEFRGSRQQQVGTTLWFSFSTLVFAHKERVVSNWTRFALIIWIFVVLILTQSYTASLASLLTVERLQPAVVDVNELKRNGYYVGYQKNSFVRELLTRQLNFEEKRLRDYRVIEDYHKALSKGSKNGGVDAIFDEMPYIKLFLTKYCAGYTVVGPTYKTDGFGFAFPLGSPLVAYVSRAILNVTQDHEKMEELQRKYFPDESKCEDPSSTFSSENPSLSVYSFGGLFIITAVISVSSCFIYILSNFIYRQWPSLNSIYPEASSLLSKISKHFHQNRQPTDQRQIPEPSSATNASGGEASQMLESFNQGLDNVATYEQRGMSKEVSGCLDERDSEIKRIHEARLALHKAELDKLLGMAVQEMMAVEIDKALQRAGLLDLGSSLAALVGMAGGTNKTTSQSTNQVTEVNTTTNLPAATAATQDYVVTPDI
ncbi:hypothetical protein M0R45_019180 [Rubus argutus]|uniref:Ionotropic glutamate receptor C-terminal domain-containing protein n=1 Tax=Rubus argutus TaxID=59490 RepID=A0AAW1X6M4_RUBAR